MVWKRRKHKVLLVIRCVSWRNSLNQSVWRDLWQVFQGRLLSLNSWKKAKYPIRRSFVNLWLELSLVTLDNMWKSGHYCSWWRKTEFDRDEICIYIYIYIYICAGAHDGTSSVEFSLNSGISKKIFKLQFYWDFSPLPLPPDLKKILTS